MRKVVEPQIYKDRAGQWRWRLRARNGRIIGTSEEGRSTRRACERNLASVATTILATVPKVVLSLLAVLLSASVVAAQPLAPGTYDPATLFLPGTQIIVPNPVPTLYPLSVVKAGTGDGIVTFVAGPYAAGALVEIQAVPTSGSTFDGFTPSPCAFSFPMPAAPLTCTATFTLIPAPTFTLTVASAGPGSGTVSVSPTGPQVAGTPMTLTATPAPGSTFVGWSVGCAPGMAMPAQHLTCTATFELAPVPPTGGMGTWNKISVGASGRWNWYYNVAAVCADTGDIWLSWSGITTKYNSQTNVWATEGANSMGWRENFAAACDPDQNVIHISAGTSGPPEWSSNVTYNRTTKLYALAGGGGCNAHAAMGYDPTRKRLLTWGGWSTNCSLLARGTNPSTSWAPLNPSGPKPPLTTEGARETNRRSGVDSRNGDGWVFADNQELYRYIAALNAWQHVPTTGPKPPTYTIFALHEASNTYVGVTGCNGLNDSDCSSQTRQTYLLDAATWTWRLGPANAAAPEAMAMSKRHAMYDVLRQRVLVVTASPQPVNGLLGTAVWAWTPSGGTVQLPVPLTVAKVGMGDGDVSGEGSYLPGAPVTVTAVAKPDSTFAGVMPADPCAVKPTFPMPALPLTCTAVFDKKPLPPVGGGGIFQAFDLPPLVSGQAATAPFSKHGNTKDVPCVWVESKQRLLCGTGDFTNAGTSDSGQNAIYALDVLANAWSTVAHYCQPAGQIGLNHSQDKGPFFYNPDDDALYVWVGIAFPDQAGQTCNVATSPTRGSIYTSGLLKWRFAEGRYTQVSPGGTSSRNVGHYDVSTQRLLYIDLNAGCGGGTGGWFRALNPATMTSSQTAFCRAANPQWKNGVSAGYINANSIQYLYKFGWWPEKQTAYIVTTHPYLTAAGSPVRRDPKLWRFERATSTFTELASPPFTGTFPAESNSADFNLAAHMDLSDPADPRVLWPVVTNPCAKIQQMLVYHVNTNTWEAVPIVGDKTQDIRGSSQAMTPHGLFLAGSVFCSDGNQQYAFLWKYKKAA